MYETNTPNTDRSNGSVATLDAPRVAEAQNAPAPTVLPNPETNLDTLRSLLLDHISRLSGQAAVSEARATLSETTGTPGLPETPSLPELPLPAAPANRLVEPEVEALVTSRASLPESSGSAPAPPVTRLETAEVPVVPFEAAVRSVTPPPAPAVPASVEMPASALPAHYAETKPRVALPVRIETTLKGPQWASLCVTGWDAAASLPRITLEIKAPPSGAQVRTVATSEREQEEIPIVLLESLETANTEGALLRAEVACAPGTPDLILEMGANAGEGVSLHTPGKATAFWVQSRMTQQPGQGYLLRAEIGRVEGKAELLLELSHALVPGESGEPAARRKQLALRAAPRP